MNAQFHRCIHATVDRSQVIRRRDFLRTISAAGVAAGSLRWVDLMTAEADELRRRGMACILLWMQGGPSQFETFSPKPGHANGGETKALATRVAGIEYSENLPELAKVADRLAVIRSMSSREGSHPRASFLLHTGYLPTATVKYPTLGSIVTSEIGDPTSELPSFVRIGGGGRNGGDSGFLGRQFAAFDVNNAERPPTNAQPTTDVPRFKRRLDLLSRLESEFAQTAPKEVADHQALYERASKMVLSSRMKAFDLSQEPASLRAAYGEGRFATGCLLARRLVESGVTFIEVVSNGWDTHDNNFERSRQLTGQIDRPFAQLIRDLDQRGMLERTLIVWMGEFGRTPGINPRGGRDHFPRAFNVALAGGGVRGGQVVGSTNAAGTQVTDQPVAVPDLFRSICRSLQIDADKENLSSIGRPIRIADEGKVVESLFTG